MTPAQQAAYHLTQLVCTLYCRRLPLVLVAGLPVGIRNEAYFGEHDDAAELFARSLGRPLEIVHGELYAAFDDPVELLVAAHAHALRPMRLVVAPSTLVLLREDREPARTAWGWFVGLLGDVTGAPGRIDDAQPIRTVPASLDELADRPGVVLWVVYPGGEQLLLLDRRLVIACYSDGLRVVEERVAGWSYDLVPGPWQLVDTDSLHGFVVDAQVRRGEAWTLRPGQHLRILDVSLLVVSVR